MRGHTAVWQGTRGGPDTRPHSWWHICWFWRRAGTWEPGGRRKGSVGLRTQETSLGGDLPQTHRQSPLRIFARCRSYADRRWESRAGTSGGQSWLSCRLSGMRRPRPQLLNEKLRRALCGDRAAPETDKYACSCHRAPPLLISGCIEMKSPHVIYSQGQFCV